MDDSMRHSTHKQCTIQRINIGRFNAPFPSSGASRGATTSIHSIIIARPDKKEISFLSGRAINRITFFRFLFIAIAEEYFKGSVEQNKLH